MAWVLCVAAEDNGGALELEDEVGPALLGLNTKL